MSSHCNALSSILASRDFRRLRKCATACCSRSIGVASLSNLFIGLWFYYVVYVLFYEDNAVKYNMVRISKVVVCGQAAVGKTAILEQLVNGDHVVGSVSKPWKHAAVI